MTGAHAWIAVASIMLVMLLLTLSIYWIRRGLRFLRFMREKQEAERERGAAHQRWLDERRRASVTPREYLYDRHGGMVIPFRTKG